MIVNMILPIKYIRNFHGKIALLFPLVHFKFVDHTILLAELKMNVHTFNVMGCVITMEVCLICVLFPVLHLLKFHGTISIVRILEPAVPLQ